jgi:hypothetical protein
VKIKDSHIDTRRIVFDEALSQRLADSTEPPDANGCMFWNERNRKHILVALAEGGSTIVSVLRVAFYFAGRGHTGHDQEVGHESCRNDGADGRRLCIAPDHLGRVTVKDRVRAMHRAGHRARMARTFSGRAA